MKDKEDFSKVISEVSILYELSLTVGQSLDLKVNCDRFLKTLMARKNLGFASVWIKKEYLIDPKEWGLPEERDKNSALLVYANPQFRIKEKTLPLHHPIFSLIEGKEAFSLSSSENSFSEIVIEKGIERGTFAIFALGKLGFLKLFSMATEMPFREEELNQLKNVISKFTVSLEGCIAHQKVTREIFERNQVEEALRRSEEESKRIAQENAIMAEIGKIISSSLNIDEVYERFTKEVAKLISFDRIMINIVNPENNTTSFAYIAGIDVPDRRVGDITPLKGTATFECMRTRSSLLIQPENMDECLARFPALLPTFRAGLRSIIFVPLISKDQFIGVLSLRSLKPKAYTDQDMRLTESIANQIAGAIANAQLFAERKCAEEAAARLAQENATMAEIGKIISSSLNIDEVYERFAEEVRKLIPFDRIIINMGNLKDNSSYPAYTSGIDVPGRRAGDSVPLTGTATKECMLMRSSMLIQPDHIDGCVARFPGLLPTFQAGLRSIILVPLISKDQAIGVLSLRSKKLKAYSNSDLRLAETIGTYIAGAIANAQLFAEHKRTEEALKRNQEELIKKNKEIDEHRRNLQLALEELEKAYKELKATQSKILQQEKMASIGQLAAGVAHEINNPVAFISSNLGTLDKYVGRLTEFIQTQSQAIESLQTTDAVERLKQKQKELKLDYITEDIRGLIKESLEGSERVMKIVQGLKRFSRVDEADYKYADLNECIESTVNIVWNELKYKATLKKDYGKLPLTKCYPQQINQVFMNLLINAVHAIEKQGEITIKTWEQDKSIWAAISDTGRGIPKEHLSKIFEPFFTTKEVGKGTGLGLSITYEIVQKHNGEITVESEVGNGTTFTVRIPIT